MRFLFTPVIYATVLGSYQYLIIVKGAKEISLIFFWAIG